jgi:hypothetical protein
MQIVRERHDATTPSRRDRLSVCCRACSYGLRDASAAVTVLVLAMEGFTASSSGWMSMTSWPSRDLP